jgi:hypothetical protein
MNEEKLEKMSKKPFKETKLGKFIDSAKPIVGSALDFVGEATGISIVEKIGEAIADKRDQSPENMALHQEFQSRKIEFELEMQRMDLDAFREEVKDRDSARSREVEYMKASGGKRDPMMFLVVGTALGVYVGIVVFMAAGPPIHPEKRDLFNMVIGQVLTFAGMAFAYYLGTTRSSKQKDDIISKSLIK